MLIGLVSDNHGLIDPGLEALLRGAQEIWHAGDLVTPDILGALERIAPVFAVRGNNDRAPPLLSLPEERLLERGGHRVLLRHIVGRPPKLNRSARTAIEAHRADIVVMGHSHRPDATLESGVLYLNPGSCGPRRFTLPRTAATLRLEGNALTFTMTNLETGRRTEDHFSLPTAA